MGLRIAEVDERAIAQVFGDEAAVQAGEIANSRMIDSQQFLHVLRVEAGGERRRADEVTEHDSEVSSLGLIGSFLTCRLRRRGRQFANRVKNLPPVADRRNADLLQVVGRQAGQDVEVDPVVAKRLLVGLQAEVAQPLPDVQVASARAPLAYSNASRCPSPLRFRLSFWFNQNRLFGFVYDNFLPEDETERVQGAYGSNYPRPAALKAKYVACAAAAHDSARPPVDQSVPDRPRFVVTGFVLQK